MNQVKVNPLSLLFFIICAGAFFVAPSTDPDNVRFRASDVEALAERRLASAT